MLTETIGTQSRPQRNTDVRFRRLDDKYVLILGGRIYQLNETAEKAWVLASGDLTVGEIAAEVAAEFDAPAGAVEQDLTELFGELRELGVVVVD